MGRTKLREKQVVDADFLSETELEDMKGIPLGLVPLNADGKIDCVYIDNACLDNGSQDDDQTEWPSQIEW